MENLSNPAKFAIAMVIIAIVGGILTGVANFATTIDVDVVPQPFTKMVNGLIIVVASEGFAAMALLVRNLTGFARNWLENNKTEYDFSKLKETVAYYTLIFTTAMAIPQSVIPPELVIGGIEVRTIVSAISGAVMFLFDIIKAELNR